jgi:hypothetical protein
MGELHPRAVRYTVIVMASEAVDRRLLSLGGHPFFCTNSRSLKLVAAE